MIRLYKEKLHLTKIYLKKKATLDSGATTQHYWCNYKKIIKHFLSAGAMYGNLWEENT